MAAFKIDGDALLISLSRGEKIAGLLRDLRVPLSAIREVDVVAQPLRATRGLRAPGSGFPLLLKMGTWRAPHHKSYVVVRGNRPGVRVQLEGEPYDEVLIGTREAERVCDALRHAVATNRA